MTDGSRPNRSAGRSTEPWCGASFIRLPAKTGPAVAVGRMRKILSATFYVPLMGGMRGGRLPEGFSPVTMACGGRQHDVEKTIKAEGTMPRSRTTLARC